MCSSANPLKTIRTMRGRAAKLFARGRTGLSPHGLSIKLGHSLEWMSRRCVYECLEEEQQANRRRRGQGHCSLGTGVAAAQSTNPLVGIQYEEIVEAEEGEDLDEIFRKVRSSHNCEKTAMKRRDLRML